MNADLELQTAGAAALVPPPPAASDNDAMRDDNDDGRAATAVVARCTLDVGDVLPRDMHDQRRRALGRGATAPHNGVSVSQIVQSGRVLRVYNRFENISIEVDADEFQATDAAAAAAAAAAAEQPQPPLLATVCSAFYVTPPDDAAFASNYADSFVVLMSGMGVPERDAAHAPGAPRAALVDARTAALFELADRARRPGDGAPRLGVSALVGGVPRAVVAWDFVALTADADDLAAVTRLHSALLTVPPPTAAAPEARRTRRRVAAAAAAKRRR